MANALIRFENDHDAKTKHVDRRSIHIESPTTLELDSMKIGAGAKYTGPPTKPDSVHYNDIDSGDAGIPTPAELESSRPPSPVIRHEAAEAVQSMWNPYMNRWRLLGACMSIFSNGLNDSAPGALLPYMEQHYHVKYALISLIFITNAVGFILAAFFVHALDSKLGRARTLMVADAVTVGGYLMIVTSPPFPVFVLGYLFTGLGMATTLALQNVFCANLANSTVTLGLLHGSYGIGGVLAPIIGTALASHGVLFSRFYLLIIGLRLVTCFFNGWANRYFERDNHPLTLLTPLEREQQRHLSAEISAEPSKLKSLGMAMKNRSTIIGAFFIFAYQGAEVSISGWVISFLISYRGGVPSKIGYVTAGFWGGITIGRFVLSHTVAFVGEKLFICGLIFGSIGFQLLVWLVPNAIGDSVAVAILGLLLGPIYPAATSVFTRLIPRRLQNTALAFISSAGSSGGALAPFATGVIAQAAGIWVLHPICIALFIAMIGFWFGLPNAGKRRE